MSYLRSMVSKVASVVLLLMIGACTAPNVPVKEADALAEGRAIADAAFQALSGQLQQAMADGGPVHAVDHCSFVASNLMDSLGGVYEARIRRTSDRIRAAEDRPDAEETRIYQEMLDTWRGTDPDQVVEHQVIIRPDTIAYYRPIFIQSPACLKCHGTPENGLDSAGHALIRERYPDDAATGYALGDLRGMWSIRWARERTE